jgi:trimethylamine-N-oxide reductase cytochrome c-type subunit TorC
VNGAFATILDDLRSVLQDPQADPRQTVLFLGAGVVIVLLLVFLALFLVSERPEKNLAPAEPRGRTRMTLVLSLMLIGGAVLLAGDWYGSRSATCGRCHALQASTQSWQAGTHAAVDCLDCHADPGLAGALGARVRGLGNLAAHIAGSEPFLSTSVPNGACLRCHGDVDQGVRVNNGIRVRHRDFLEVGTGCVDCHRGAGHDVAGGTGGGDLMERCLPCHDAVKAPAACAVCHPGPRASDKQTTEDFPEVDLPSDQLCEDCHDLDVCRTCHGIDLPHPADFAEPGRHAPLAAFGRKEQICYSCHEQQDCAQCHQSFASHGPEWEERHALGPRPDPACANCHTRSGEADFCDLCHPRPGQAPLPGQVPIGPGPSDSGA